MTKQKRNMPAQKEILSYWEDKLLILKKNLFSCKKDIKDCCFACGLYTPFLDRAHIKARANGGSDIEDNLHLLCDYCHEASENIEDLEDYFEWFVERTYIDSIVQHFSIFSYKEVKEFQKRVQTAKDAGIDVCSADRLRLINKALILNGAFCDTYHITAINKFLVFEPIKIKQKEINNRIKSKLTA